MTVHDGGHSSIADLVQALNVLDMIVDAEKGFKRRIWPMYSSSAGTRDKGHAGER